MLANHWTKRFLLQILIPAQLTSKKHLEDLLADLRVSLKKMTTPKTDPLKKMEELQGDLTIPLYNS